MAQGRWAMDRHHLPSISCRACPRALRRSKTHLAQKCCGISSVGSKEPTPLPAEGRGGATTSRRQARGRRRTTTARGHARARDVEASSTAAHPEGGQRKLATGYKRRPCIARGSQWRSPRRSRHCSQKQIVPCRCPSALRDRYVVQLLEPRSRDPLRARPNCGQSGRRDDRHNLATIASRTNAGRLRLQPGT